VRGIALCKDSVTAYIIVSCKHKYSNN